MKHISSIKPTVEKGLYGLVKRPDAKTPDLSELSKTIKKFQDTPDDHFTSRLRKRVPSNSSFKLESKDDFGLSKRFKSGSLTKIETPDAAAKLVDGRFSDKSKPFKSSEGITGLNKQFEKVLPKTDYSYTDPQYYEYKLKGQTIKDQQLNAFKNQNEDDIDKLDVQGKYKKWREEELAKKANTIQKVFRGRSVREGLGEGVKVFGEALDEIPSNENFNVRDVIEVGKAKRKERHEKVREKNEELRENIQNRTNELEELYNLERESMKYKFELDKRKKEQDKRNRHNDFLIDSGIGEYALKGQETKERKKKERLEKLNKAAVFTQKLVRGKQSRINNKDFIVESAKRFMKPNPDYDPNNNDPNDVRSYKEIVHRPTATNLELKRFKQNMLQHKSNDRIALRRNQRTQADREKRIQRIEPNVLFIDDDERPLEERLHKAYSKLDPDSTINQKPNPKEQKRQDKLKNPINQAWLKKQEEIYAKTKIDQENERQHQQHSHEVENYYSLMEMLAKSNGGSKTTNEMNKLIPVVYRSFGKNPGTNTNRKVSTVIRELEKWRAEKEARQEQIAKYKAQREDTNAKQKQARLEDSKRRLAPTTRSTVHTIDSLNESESKVGGGALNMDKTNKNKSNLIPQPKKTNTISNYFSPKKSK